MVLAAPAEDLMATACGPHGGFPGALPTHTGMVGSMSLRTPFGWHDDIT